MANIPEDRVIVQAPPKRPIAFTTVLLLTLLWAAGIGLTIHFVLLSTDSYNWFNQ